MIFGVLLGKREESKLLEKEIRLAAACCTDERVVIAALFTKEERKQFLMKRELADIICIDISVLDGIGQAEEMRKHYPKAVMILIADVMMSPVSYMKPTILAAALLLKPLTEKNVHQAVREVFEQFIQKNPDEEIFVIDTREDKHRIPLADIFYFEAREKKIFACTKNREFGFYDTMDQLQERMRKSFVRCHRSYLVNRSYIDRVMLSKNCILLRDHIEIPLSRSYKEAMKQLNQ